MVVSLSLSPASKRVAAAQQRAEAAQKRAEDAQRRAAERALAAQQRAEAAQRQAAERVAKKNAMQELKLQRTIAKAKAKTAKAAAKAARIKERISPKAKAKVTKIKAKAIPQKVVALTQGASLWPGIHKQPQETDCETVRVWPTDMDQAVSHRSTIGATKRPLPGDQEFGSDKRYRNWAGESQTVSCVDVPDALGCLSASVVAADKAGFIATEIHLSKPQVAAAVRLFEEGNTLPFIARYRKDKTGCMNETDLRRVERALHRADLLEQRRKTVAGALVKLGKLEEVRGPVLAATSVEQLDDLYEPYKTKRRTRAQQAREKGLQGLANLIDNMGGKARASEPSQAAMQYVDATKEVSNTGHALAGARDIVAEKHARDPSMKAQAQQFLRKSALTVAKRRSNNVDTDEQYKNYWNYSIHLDRIQPHQFLALQRGEREKVLSVSFECAANAMNKVVENYMGPCDGSPWVCQKQRALTDGLDRLLRPTIEREWRRQLKERAEDQAFDTYRQNLKGKLLMPPASDQEPAGPIVGLDPAYKTGCKVAVVAATGSVLETNTIYPFASWTASSAAKPHLAEDFLMEVLHKWNPAVISIGNGTASGETEQFVRKVLQKAGSDVPYTITDEAGASIYSASALAGTELPDLDVCLRGAVSIARRVLDPLAELVKIHPQSLGVGLYQHDVDQTRLKAELRGVVEECVSAVGVDVNTASPILLEHIAGFGPKTSAALVSHRETSGPFRTRKDLLKVKGIGSKLFEQSSGFLRIVRGDEPLDATAVHPESYAHARVLQHRFGARCENLSGQDLNAIMEHLAEELKCGVETLRDIVTQLSGCTQDPRLPELRPLLKRVNGPREPFASLRGVQNSGADAQQLGLTVSTLEKGMWLRGIVRNVTPFGAFIDVGVQQDGLLHCSRYPKPLPHAGWPMVNQQIVVEVEGPPEKRGNRWRISLLPV